MMANEPLKKIAEPSLRDLFDSFKREIMLSMFCVRIGEIVSFDGATRTATIQLQQKKVLPDGTEVSQPQLLNCPVVFMLGGGAMLEMPVAEGDQCVVLFCDRDIEPWFNTGAEAVPMTPRAHSIADGIALMGVIPTNSTVYPDSVSGSQVLLKFGSNNVKLTSAVSELRFGSNVNLSLSSSDARLNNNGAYYSAASGKLKMANATTTLLTVMDAFIDVLVTLSTVPGGGPLNAGSIAALNAFKTTFASLLS
jgi:hypothetical protein